MVHQLAGTAPSLGFIRAGAIARRIEALLGQANEQRLAEHDWDEMKELAQSATARDEPADPVQTVRGPQERRARLLVVDDDPSFLELCGELGRRQLIDVVCMQTADEALAAAREGSYDGAIIDVWLGEKASFDLVQELRRAASGESLPIAFISADGTPQLRARAAQAGAALFLSKPLTEARLMDAATQLAALRQGERARVLLVDENAAFVGHARQVLASAGLEVDTMMDGARVLGVLEALEYDALVIDVATPGICGIDLCRVLRTNPRWQDLPILVLASSEDSAVRLEAIEAGCDDFIVKPIDDDELRVRVRARVGRRQLMRARLERDPLTGLALRRAFMEQLRSRVSEAQRRSLPLTVCMLDLDHFKDINDAFGHLTGDRVLATLGRLLATEFREGDLRARWGGEEFVVAFPFERADAIEPGIQELLNDLRATTFTDETGKRFHASFSAGLAEFPADAVTPEALIRVADERLYEAKRKGRARVIGARR